MATLNNQMVNPNYFSIGHGHRSKAPAGHGKNGWCLHTCPKPTGRGANFHMLFDMCEYSYGCYGIWVWINTY